MDDATSSSSELPLKKQIQNHGLQQNNSDELCWPVDDPDHPRNWSGWTKAVQTVIIVSLEFFTYVQQLLFVLGIAVS